MARIDAERDRAASEIQDQFNKEENESFGSDEMDRTIVENELEESVIIRDNALMMNELETCMTPRDPHQGILFQDAEILNMSRASMVSRGSILSQVRDASFINQQSFLQEHEDGEEGSAAFNFDALMRDKQTREQLSNPNN